MYNIAYVLFQYTPRVGRGDLRFRARKQLLKSFNTRPVWDGATPIAELYPSHLQFQYTPRVGRGDHDLLRVWQQAVVSIHAPCGTGRPGSCLGIVFAERFQYTPRVGRGDYFLT